MEKELKGVDNTGIDSNIPYSAGFLEQLLMLFSNISPSAASDTDKREFLILPLVP